MSKDSKTPEEIAQILGKHESELSEKAISLMQDKGLLFKTATDSVGKDIVKLMGLRAKNADDVDAQLFSALTTELGQIALAVGAGKNEDLLTKESMSSKQFARDVLGKAEHETSDSDAVVNFVNIKSKEAVEDLSFITNILENSMPNMDVRRK
ncbi:hypothetical protein, partial [Salinivibrio kushneri]